MHTTDDGAGLLASAGRREDVHAGDERRRTTTGCVDVLGIGFGPANLALAIALEEDAPLLAGHFLEAQRDPVWQGGMLLAGSNTQNHPSRDLVTLRNPRSRYSFLNYLFENGRLVDHLNLPAEFPLRKEYAQYIRWVAGYFRHVARLDSRIVDVGVTEESGEPCWVTTAEDGTRARGRSLVLGTGRTPYVPEPFAGLRSPRVVHLSDYLPAVRGLGGPPAEVAVVGGSQSAVEITLDLAHRFPDCRVSLYARTPGLRLKDTSPFSEEGYFPEFTGYYYRAARRSKHVLDAYMRPTNYSASDLDVLHELYLLMYEQRLDDAQRVFLFANREVLGAVDTGAGVELEVRERHTGQRELAGAQLVVLATGFRDLGPAPHQESHPPVLTPVIDRFEFDDDGYLAVEEDYRVRAKDPATPPLYLNGLCESTHGIGDAGSFSLLSLRAATIRDSLVKALAVREVAGG